MYNIKYMCLALPGKVKKVDGRKVLIEYPSETKEVLSGGISLEEGDYVMIQMGVVVKKITPEEAEIAQSAWK